MVRSPRYNVLNGQVIYPLNFDSESKERTKPFKMYQNRYSYLWWIRNDVSCGNIGVWSIKIAGYDHGSSMRFVVRWFMHNQLLADSVFFSRNFVWFFVQRNWIKTTTTIIRSERKSGVCFRRNCGSALTNNSSKNFACSWAKIQTYEISEHYW